MVQEAKAIISGLETAVAIKRTSKKPMDQGEEKEERQREEEKKKGEAGKGRYLISKYRKEEWGGLRLNTKPGGGKERQRVGERTGAWV